MQDTKWNPIAEGLWRWEVGKPTVSISERFNNYQVKFPLSLIKSEQDRHIAENGAPPPGVQQSFRTSYTTGLSLGYFKNNQYQTTKMVDMLAACLGSSNTKRFRDWIVQGGGPPRGEEEGVDAEIPRIEEWLGWFEGLELYGSIRHEPDSKNPDVIWARFGGPMPVGSLPGSKDDNYQAVARGKLRAMLAETKDEVPSKPMPQQEALPVDEPPAQQFDAQGKPVKGDRYKQIFGEEDDVPF
jgi:hypothetical protein